MGFLSVIDIATIKVVISYFNTKNESFETWNASESEFVMILVAMKSYSL